jgi:hypothetical protein
MSPSETREPTRDELLAMAYVDGELELAARRQFEAQLAGRPDLAREVAALQRLNVLARQLAGPEPMDHEWRRLEKSTLHGGGLRLGLALMGLGALALVAWCGWTLWASDMELLPKLALAGLLGGATLLLLLVLRARLRTLPYDPYTDIER